MRRFLCRWFRLTPNEDTVLRGWEDTLASKDFRPVWPRIINSEAWKTELQPWFRSMLVQTLLMVGVEPDPKKVIELQVQARLLNRLLEEPAVMMKRAEQIRDREYLSGQLDERFDEAQRREGVMPNGR